MMASGVSLNYCMFRSDDDMVRLCFGFALLL